MRRVVITGIGIVNPSGIGIEDFWKNVSKGCNAISKVDQLTNAKIPTQVAGQLRSFNAADYLPTRYLLKIDTFTKYAWAAANLALDDASLDLSKSDLNRTGVWLGNNAGGWDICERGLYELYRDGPEFVNPWQATAWFLSSPQGYVSIAHKICGASKSFVCDRATSASALYFAFRSIQLGENDIILAGGTEAPITPFAMTCYYDIGEMATSTDDPYCYKPFSEHGSGLLIGEGATILILEEYEHALKRNAKIYGEILSGASFTDSDPSSSQYFAKTMSLTLQKAKLLPKDIDVIFAEAAGLESLDRIEAAAIDNVFEDSNKDLIVSCPKSGFGHLYGASSATDLACGLLSAQHELIPPTPNVECAANYVNFTLPTVALSKRVNHFMVNARAREGANFSIIIRSKLK